MEITAASWNIYIFGDKNFEGMAQTIRDNEIDVIGIQEAGIYYDEEEKLNIVKEISEELGYHYRFAAAIDFREHDSEREHKMGNAVISKHPIKNAEVFSLNPEEVEYDGNPENEPRIAVKCDLEVEDKQIAFITTHLQYTNEFEPSDIRKAEIENLLQIVENEEKPVVLAGDFNSGRETDERDLLDSRLQTVHDDSPTWTAVPFDYNGWQVEGLEYRVDEVFYSDELKEIDSETLDSEISDHLPIKAKLQLD